MICLSLDCLRAIHARSLSNIVKIEQAQNWGWIE